MWPNKKKDGKQKRRKWISIVAGLVIGAIVSVTMMPGANVKKEKSAATAELTGVGKEMRKAPKDWFKQEKDISSIVKDVRNGDIVAAGLADDAVLVSTTKGAKYYVSDTRYGRVGDLVLSSYHNEKLQPFTVVFLDGVKRVPPTESNSGLVYLEIGGRFLSMVFMLGMLVGLVALIKQSREQKFELQEATDIRFDDVVGAAEAKNAVSDIVAYLKDPESFSELGGRPARGVLMVGPPGTGKTRLAQALAGECGVSFISINGSDFSSKYYGVAIQRVKALFKLARDNAPCIVFIDEIDGVGKRTTSSDSPAAAESNRIVNQILVEMNGFKTEDGVIVIGATNLVEMLDEAMLRPGRFDRQVYVRLPELQDRRKIFELYAKKIKTAEGVDFEQLGRLTIGMSPAAIEVIVNQAALLAAKEKAQVVELAHFQEAIEVARMGEANQGAKAMSEAERKRVAVHEAGHAFIAHKLGAGRVEKVTILPRGRALGVTLVTQDEDQYLHLKSELENRIVMLLGGRCAELLMLGEASTGAGQDLKEASKLALAMVSQYGFNEAGSLFSLSAIQDATLAQPEMGKAIEAANNILKAMEQKCFACLEESRDALVLFSERLLAEETLPGEAVAEALAVRALKKVA